MLPKPRRSVEWFESVEIGFLWDDIFGLNETGLGIALGTIEGKLRITEPGFGSRFFFFCFSASSSKSLSQLTLKQKIMFEIEFYFIENYFLLDKKLVY